MHLRRVGEWGCMCMVYPSVGALLDIECILNDSGSSPAGARLELFVLHHFNPIVVRV